jgi:hypothetical protein
MFDFNVRLSEATGLMSATLEADGVHYLVVAGSTDCGMACGNAAQVRVIDTQPIWQGISGTGLSLVRSDVWRFADGFVVNDTWTAY